MEILTSCAGKIYRVSCAAPVPASACQISSRPDFFVIASWTCLPPASSVMTIQSRLASRDGAWLNAMVDPRPVKANSREAPGKEIMNASVPTTRRFGPLKRIHWPRVPSNPPLPRMLTWSSDAERYTCACISSRSGAFVERSRFRRMNKYIMPPTTTNDIRAGSTHTLTPYGPHCAWIRCNRDRCRCAGPRAHLGFRRHAWPPPRALVWRRRRRFNRRAGPARVQPGAEIHSGFPWHSPEVTHPHLADGDSWWRHLGEVLAAAMGRLGVAPAAAAAAASRVRSHYVDPASWQLFPDTVPALVALSDLGWRHVLLSNHVPELPQIVTGCQRSGRRGHHSGASSSTPIALVAGGLVSASASGARSAISSPALVSHASRPRARITSRITMPITAQPATTTGAQPTGLAGSGTSDL